MKQTLLLLTFLISSFNIFAEQSEIDSLCNKLKTPLSYEQKTDVIFELSKVYLRHNPDSSYSYAKQLEAIAKQHNDKITLAKAELRIGYYLSRAGKPAEALSIAEKNIAMLQNDAANR